MKRCPECHFTFADDERVCDFDRTQLNGIPEPHPSRPTPQRGLLHSHGLVVVLTLVGLILSALMVGYFEALDQDADAAAGSQAQESSLNIAPPALTLPLPKPNQTNQLQRTNPERRASPADKSELHSIVRWPRSAYHSRSSQLRSRSANARALSNNQGLRPMRERQRAKPSAMAGNRNRPASSAWVSQHRNSVARSPQPLQSQDAMVHHSNIRKLLPS
jgi:hypothetical protein